MGFLSRPIPDDEWTRSARSIFDAAIGPARALSDAIRREDLDRQVEAISAVARQFPPLKDSLRDIGSPTSADARGAKKEFEFALKDYVDGASQGHKLFVDLQKGLAGRITSGGFAGRAATSRFVFQKGVYEDIVKKAERRLESARVFLGVEAPQEESLPISESEGYKAAGPSLTWFFINTVDELRSSLGGQKQVKLSQVATAGSWCFSQAAILGMLVSREPEQFLSMVWDPKGVDKFLEFIDEELERIDRAGLVGNTSLGYIRMTTQYPQLYGSDALRTAVASGRLKEFERLANSLVPLADAQTRWSMDTAVGFGLGIHRPLFVRSCLESIANPDRESWSRAHEAGVAIPAEADAMSVDEQIEGVLDVCRVFFQEYYPEAKRKLDALAG